MNKKSIYINGLYYYLQFEMPDHCCVPGCQGNYESTKDKVSAFKFPKDPELKSKWARMIPRKDLTVTNRTVVCEKHFAAHFIIRTDTAIRPDGTVLSVPRKNPKLALDAYPSYFPNTPSYLSSEPPTKRRAPESRRAELEERDEQCFEKWVKEDGIDNFDVLHSRVSEYIMKDYCTWNTCIETDKIILYRIDSSEAPCITVSIRIDNSLCVTVFKGLLTLDSSSLKWILGQECKLSCWSQLCSLLSHFSTAHIELSLDDNVKCVQLALEKLEQVLSESDIYDAGMIHRFKFILEQFKLLFVQQPRYSAETIMLAFNLLCLSPSTYKAVRERMLLLPHVSYLRKLTQNLSITEDGVEGSNGNNISYLKRKVELLKDYERHVILCLDEIHVSPTTRYKNGLLIGMASNTPNEEATSVQTFMINSLLSPNKDVVCMVPVKNMNAVYLKECTVKVISMLESIGYKIVCCISDNNRVNRNMMTAICNGKLQASIVHPCDADRRLFFLFDSVCLLKCIRNNWLGQLDCEHTLMYPEFHSEMSDNIARASFSHLRKLHESEKECIVKLAPSLSQKALYPTNLERQNVNLALKIFDEKVPVALNHFGKQTSIDVVGTASFIHIVLRLWKILNVKSTGKGIRKRDDDCKPITSVDDDRVHFLREVVLWLNRWENMKQKARQGRLTDETLFALKHTVATFVELVDYLLKTLKLSYVLSGKFQTDCLESRFGKYRQLSGAHYNVSVQEIRESEKKLRILSLLRVLSFSQGDVTLVDILSKDFDCTCDDSKFDDNLDEYCTALKEVIYKCDDVAISESEAKSLIFIAGYVARKVVCSKISCELCASEIITQDKLEVDIQPGNAIAYLADIDRGGLKWPTDFLVGIVNELFRVFSCLLSKDYEEKFLKVTNQKKCFLQLSLERLLYCDLNNTDCECGQTTMQLCKLCMGTVANIFLNNYCKRAADKRVAAKNKRKLSTLTK